MKFVNIDQVITDSGLAAQEKAHLQLVHESLQNGVKIVENNYKTMPQDKVAQARQADAYVLNAQWQAQQQAARNAVLAQVKIVSDQYLADHKVDAILPTQTAMSYSKAADITAELVTQLKEVKINFGDVPKITQKEPVVAPAAAPAPVVAPDPVPAPAAPAAESTGSQE